MHTLAKKAKSLGAFNLVPTPALTRDVQGNQFTTLFASSDSAGCQFCKFLFTISFDKRPSQIIARASCVSYGEAD